MPSAEPGIDDALAALRKPPASARSGCWPRASTSTWSTCTEVFPELVLDLLCYGPIERGLDASHGGVEFYNLCVDGAALATTADSFAAVEQRIEREGRMTWAELLRHSDADWAGPEENGPA